MMRWNPGGVSRTITSDNGIEYHMLEAEYDFQGNNTLQQVMDKAKAAANKTDKNYSIFVTESAGRTWHNLNRTD